jgi:catechol 2,3-dioxygenase-like lactoylglutathione lyase family enzyme
MDYAKTAWPALWKDRGAFEPTRGRAIDHIGFAVDDVPATVARLRKEGVNVLMEPRPIANGAAIVAFVEAPDRVWVELVQDKKQ